MTVNIKPYLKNVLEPSEKLVCFGGLHWIYLSSGLFYLLCFAGIGWGADYGLWHYLGRFVPDYEIDTGFFRFGLREGWIGWMFTSCGLVIFLTQFLRYVSTAVIVTSMRIIQKEGWINIRIDGTDISDVRGVHVDQGWLGRFLNYGKIRLDCRFIDDVLIPYVKDAYKFTRHIQHVKTELEQGEAARAPMDAARPHAEAPHQTIIQINTGNGGTDIIQKDEKTLIIRPHEDPVAIEHKLHDEILDDFKTKA